MAEIVIRYVIFWLTGVRASAPSSGGLRCAATTGYCLASLRDAWEPARAESPYTNWDALQINSTQNPNFFLPLVP